MQDPKILEVQMLKLVVEFDCYAGASISLMDCWCTKTVEIVD